MRVHLTEGTCRRGRSRSSQTCRRGRSRSSQVCFFVLDFSKSTTGIQSQRTIFHSQFSYQMKVDI
ncbi:unnamed protein product, partial [Callosobruchus maculatus]